LQRIADERKAKLAAKKQRLAEKESLSKETNNDQVNKAAVGSDAIAEIMKRAQEKKNSDGGG